MNRHWPTELASLETIEEHYGTDDGVSEICKIRPPKAPKLRTFQFTTRLRRTARAAYRVSPDCLPPVLPLEQIADSLEPQLHQGNRDAELDPLEIYGQEALEHAHDMRLAQLAQDVGDTALRFC
ncbi:MAG TPA: hypothetical protein VK712_02480 [Verrucomicrobiae bacterium]|jgi:hypothetical protein|nr:hypothetical protein [Verrucomicrobiae bacterium]